MNDTTQYDVIIVGGGIAGTSRGNGRIVG